MKLYNADPSPNCLRVRAVIFELGLSVEFEEVDLSSKTKPAEVLAVNPMGKVPVFVDDDGFSLFESRAINAYLAEKRPERGLYPRDIKQRALVDQWSYWHALHLGPAMQAIGFERVVKSALNLGPPDETLVSAKAAEVERALPTLESGLLGKQWLIGQLSLADFAVAASFSLRTKAGISLANAPNVAAWIERLEQLPSWQRALPRWP